MSLNWALFSQRSRGLSYHRLPQHLLLNLYVLKLDGSSFGVHVARNATVAELKLAVEEIFSFSLSPKEDQSLISWSHVWGHFCLCYEGQKLIDDKAYIRSFGIKDGDQLQFIQHLSINSGPEKQRSKIQGVASRQCLMLLSSGSCDGVDREQQANIIEGCKNKFKNYQCKEDETIPMPEFKLAHFFKWECLSHSKMWGVTRKNRRQAFKIFPLLNNVQTGMIPR